MSHLSDENLSENDVLVFDEPPICTWHLDRLRVAVGMKEDFEANILLRLQMCLDNGSDINKLLKDLEVRI